MKRILIRPSDISKIPSMMSINLGRPSSQASLILQLGGEEKNNPKIKSRDLSLGKLSSIELKSNEDDARFEANTRSNRKNFLVQYFEGLTSYFQDGSASEDADNETEFRRCNICLHDFLVGDDIASSRNMKCPHVYHKECIIEWLMDHDECPNCRQDYLFAGVDHEVDEITRRQPTEITVVTNASSRSVCSRSVDAQYHIQKERKFSTRMIPTYDDIDPVGLDVTDQESFI